jgi:hypothetical protein
VEREMPRDAQDEEKTDKLVLEFVEDRHVVRLGDITTELDLGVSKALASLKRLLARGLVDQAGTPKTPSARWVRKGFVWTPGGDAPQPRSKIVDAKPESRSSKRPAKVSRHSLPKPASVSVRRSRSSRPETSVEDHLQALADRLGQSLSRIPGDVALVLCREVEACYKSAGVDSSPPWRR